MISRPVNMLFALLCSSLNGQEPEALIFQGASPDDWKECYSIAVAQGVMALAWDGVTRLPSELMPPRSLKLPWGLAVGKYEENYLRYCRTVAELSGIYREKGIVTVQLKGVGFSTYYPVPSHREGGDIDIYTFSADRNKMSDAQANSLADSLIRDMGIQVDFHSYKHSNFYYKGIPIENHKTLVNVKDIEEASLVNDVLLGELSPVSVQLAEGEILVPSAAFNSLFIAFHALQHYGSGLALHHLCDWAMILKRNGLNIPPEITFKPFLRGVSALSLLCNRYLGSSVQAAPGCEELADEMLAEILHPKFAAEVPAGSRLHILSYKFRRMLHTHKLKKSVFGIISLSKRLWVSFTSHIQNPETIFSRGEK